MDWVQIPKRRHCLCRLSLFLVLLVFLRVLRLLPLLKNQDFQIPIRDLEHTDTFKCV